MNEEGRSPRPGEHEIDLLRVCYELDRPRAVWRASVAHGTSARRSFATPGALLHFLGEHLEKGQAAGAAPEQD